MPFDLCSTCDGTGERDWLSGARCYDCNGTGWRQETELTDEERDSMEAFWDEFHAEESR